ncbi:hypothetical protein [Motiliproteus sp. SC1-56]|uniref:hypothetical protein n=1 Tax=Motiliproteus sp. SC1-56 TaxID=2799565 RepID=UPI001A8EF3F8|nr:hypothetical protein [Motiliproteus sp. SC1-56]
MEAESAVRFRVLILEHYQRKAAEKEDAEVAAAIMEAGLALAENIWPHQDCRAEFDELVRDGWHVAAAKAKGERDVVFTGNPFSWGNAL